MTPSVLYTPRPPKAALSAATSADSTSATNQAALGMMRLHSIAGYIEQIYLVEYPDKLLLLDGCSYNDVPHVIAFIEQTLCRHRQALTLVAVTHMHPDHAGGAHRLRHLTGCRIASLNKPGQWYQGITGLSMYMVDSALAWYVAYRQRKPMRKLLYCPYLFADYLLNDGECLPGFADWQVLDTHGHTDRDLSLWHAASGQIYVGDVLIKLRHKYVSPFPIYFIEHYRQTLARIHALRPNYVLMAHGGRQHITEDEWQAIIQHAPTKRRTVADTMQHTLRWRPRHTREHGVKTN